jgi:3-oxoadipate enol-lactonase
MEPSVYLEGHGDGTPVLFIHGAPTPWDVLRPIAQACRGFCTVLAALPGYGAAPAWPGPVSASKIAEQIEQAMIGAGHRSLSIVGFSGGAYHALHVATRGVLDVSKVIAIGGFAELSLAERAGLRGFATALRTGTALAGIPTARFLSPRFAQAHPEACTRVEGYLTATMPENLAHELDAVAEGPSLLEGLRSFQGIVIARTGALDVAMPSAHAQNIAGACRRGVVQIVSECGHALLEEDRDATIAAVVESLA